MNHAAMQHPEPNPKPLSNSASLLGALSALLLSGCQLTSPATEQKLSQTAAYALTKTVSVAEATILQGAISLADGQAKGDYLQGLALGFRSQEGSLLTSDDVAQLVSIWTPKTPSWAKLGGQLATVYTQASPKTPKEAQVVLESMAQGLEVAK